MTAPVAKKATAAELREAFIIRCSCDQEVHDDSRADFVADLDRLLAAARAEAVADVWRAIGLNPDAFGSGTRPVAEAVAIALEDARAEAVTPVLAVLRQLVAAMPRCTAGGCGSAACDGCEVMCGRTATRGVVCDEHGDGELDSDYAAPLRAALALLAADQAGAKAGKP